MTQVLNLQTPKHIKEWLGLLSKNKLLVVEASRDHGKSWVFSYVWPLFNCQKVRNAEPENIALISYSEDQAKKNLQRIRIAIETNQTLKWLMPTSKAYVWDASTLNMSNGCTIETFGFGSSVRGGHYHRIIVDDPTKDHWTISIAEQENFFYGVILPALRRGGQLIVSGNPVEKQDLIERLEGNKEFPHFKYPVINKKGEALWPEERPLDWIESRKRMMPAHTFAREYMLRRISPADARFKEEWIRWYDYEDFENQDSKLYQKPLFKVLTIDPAISPGGDALAVVVTGTDTSDNTYVLDVMAHRGELRSGISKICSMIEAYKPDEIGFETFAFQKMYKVLLEEELKRREIFVVIKEIGKNSQKTKAMRIEMLQPKVSSGKLWFRKDRRSIVDQLTLWDPLSKNNDDDEIDALAWQVKMWRRPYVEGIEERDVRPGSFAEAFQEISHKNDGWLGHLFEDLGGLHG